MEISALKRIVEAALLASSQPLTLAQLTELFHEAERPPLDLLRAALAELARDCEQRGIRLREVASGWRFQVAEDIFPHLQGLWAERPQRYSRALLETLALIAYRQPITRGEIEAVRGVAVSQNIIRTLLEREWVRVIGHRDVVGRPALYGTTKAFLDYFNLKGLDQLPALSELKDLDSLEPELDLPAPGASAPADDETATDHAPATTLH